MTALTVSSRPLAVPQYATKRNPDRPTYGPHVDAVAAALGHPSMPWQEYVNAVANEVMPDGSFAYPTVVLSTPRQSGKTTLLESILVHRCMAMPDFRSWYTAQSGQDARDVWREWERNVSAKMPGRWKARQSNGEETLTWPAHGSFVRTFPPVASALHGKQSDFVALDEVWDYTTEQGKSITQAVVPTQATRPRRQLWIVSTAGDESSVWMRAWVDRARESLDNPDSSIAYFDWSAPPDMDPTDPANWPLFHPAYGHTIGEAAMRDALDQMGKIEFSRAYGNQWPPPSASWRTGWPDLASPDRIPTDARVYLAVDALVSHRQAAIAAAAPLPDGRIAVEIVDHRPGVDWLVARLLEVSRQHRSPIAVNSSGPLGYLIPELQQAGCRVEVVTGTGYADAAARLRTLIVEGRIAHMDDPRLNRAIEGVETRPTGDRSVWKKKDSTVDETPLVAVSLAVRQAVIPGAKPGIHVAEKKT